VEVVFDAAFGQVRYGRRFARGAAGKGRTKQYRDQDKGRTFSIQLDIHERFP